jgi:uncharacterized protein DUF1592/uncharacterized protein DUF1588/uncharacterized protein DUF1587/uncharacterized protein DUF1585/uncharacterized protein DUF1595
MRSLVCLMAVCACVPVAAGFRPSNSSEFITTPADPAPPVVDVFASQVKPFIQKFCVGCHNDKKDSGGLNIAHADSQAVLADRETWETVRRRVLTKEMPPKNKPKPEDAERAEFVAWIDAQLKNAKATPPTPGRVTMRRLNRDEYNRTIHELCGVNLMPADDFPSDDVGHGFDNIGDVLSMPPILLEKYLSAAEKIVNNVIVGDPVKPESRRYLTKDMKATDKVDHGNKDGNPTLLLDHAGAVYIMHDVPRAGELVVRPLVYASPAGREAKNDFVRVALRLDGKEFHTQRVTFGSPGQIEGRVKVTPGQHRIAIAFTNASGDDVKEKRKTLAVIAFEVENPIEMQTDKPASYKLVYIGDPSDESSERARRIISNFARRAFRRLATSNDVDRLMKLFDLAKRGGDSFERSVGVALQAALVSPYFLFRVEPDRQADRADGSYSLNSWEIASRLSYFLWSSMPDDELFRLAEQGRLRDPEVLESQVKRMLKDPRSIALVQNFGDQWLNLRNLQTSQPAKRDFPLFDEQLRAAMKTETEMFFANVMRENRSIVDFLDADYTFVNGRLARHYGISGVSGPEFRRVTLSDHNRGGVLTQASVLTVTSNPTRTSPVKRGKWILDNILGAPPPPPPPEVPVLNEDKEATSKGSLRERMKQHRTNPSCAVCHERMDTIGFGFENFDAIGAWRTMDGKFKIDSSGTLPDGQSFQTPAELKELLKAQLADFRRCLTEKLMTYALGRGMERADRPEIERISGAVAADGNRFDRMIVEIVKGDAFLRRTVKK